MRTRESLSDAAGRCAVHARRRSASELAEQPRAGFEPIALHGAQRDAERLRRLLLAEPAEEAALDDLREAWQLLGQTLQCGVERQQALVGLHCEIFSV